MIISCVQFNDADVKFIVNSLQKAGNRLKQEAIIQL